LLNSDADASSKNAQVKAGWHSSKGSCQSVARIYLPIARIEVAY
jgi:hypothetical protein